MNRSQRAGGQSPGEAALLDLYRAFARALSDLSDVPLFGSPPADPAIHYIGNGGFCQTGETGFLPSTTEIEVKDRIRTQLVPTLQEIATALEQEPKLSSVEDHPARERLVQTAFLILSITNRLAMENGGASWAAELALQFTELKTKKNSNGVPQDRILPNSIPLTAAVLFANYTRLMLFNRVGEKSRGQAAMDLQIHPKIHQRGVRDFYRLPSLVPIGLRCSLDQDATRHSFSADFSTKSTKPDIIS